MANKERSGLNLLLIVVLIMIISTVTTYLIAKYMLANASGEEKEEKQYITYQLGDYLTNLSDKGYIKLSIVCLLNDKETEKQLQAKEYEIKDKVYAILRSKTYDSIKDSQGMQVLKKELKDMINKALENGKVEDVFFTSIIVN